METHTGSADRIAVTAVSPDGSVKAQLADGDVTMNLNRRMLPRHDDFSLARQCGLAASGALAGGERALAMRAARDSDDATSDPEYGRMAERFEDELSHIVTSGRSGPVTVTLRGRTNAEFALRPRTANYLGAEQLARHLAAALAEARQAQVSPVIDICTRVFD
ncbi:hypothetical protein [Stackebrandtia nassauensis]|uniref:Uncharacterized protein n=1 Tax=Stackebrandtia nassauensis (strain DSM 44728 / CIP 108903 / NRRL B-16338 / NBRC 102104 / LLR-40K-21) TaxID=446470 RepID=D3PVE0_STANL|nr:hypothetical protein [Stackebrandtia nassauensis]ADD41193.1 hypothetical protein Snas_1489 [Stackebrandtia nassauensis DSM 44728]